MRYGSVCSGIEAASVAWHPLGWSPAWFAEIATPPSRVLEHRWPHVTNLGDFTTIKENHGPIDLLVGGTPCQSFSVAGARAGLADSRGNLALEYLRLAQRMRARWIVWENVPGVLSSNGGRDFGSFLGLLADVGYGFAYRVLDAQGFGVPQRRRRVFVVGYLGDWRRAAAVLFERASLSGDSLARRAKREIAPRAAPDRASESGGVIPFDTTQITNKNNRSRPLPGDVSPTLSAHAHPPAIAFHTTQDPISSAVASPCLSAKGLIGVWAPTVARTLTTRYGCRNSVDGDTFLALPGEVRRLTPRECERLQGFPDDYTATPDMSDSDRYHVLGNSMAVPVMRWIGERIAAVDGLENHA